MKKQIAAALLSLTLAACASSPIILTQVVTVVVTAAPPAATAAPAEPTAAPPTAEPPAALNWDEAAGHIGEEATVCGLVMGATYASGSNGQPTFLNVGRDFPDPARFTVVIWGADRSTFPTPPETAYLNQTICVEGIIEEFDGMAEMIINRPSQITVVP
jgi:DNA/RNA endonuclease YhcR with UshA esterase domain